jgi:hypothetical protein
MQRNFEANAFESGTELRKVSEPCPRLSHYSPSNHAQQGKQHQLQQEPSLDCEKFAASVYFSQSSATFSEFFLKNGTPPFKSSVPFEE